MTFLNSKLLGISYLEVGYHFKYAPLQKIDKSAVAALGEVKMRKH